MKALIKNLAQYCQDNIEDYELRAQLALDQIDKWRAPLSMVDSGLYDQMLESCEEYCEENDIDPECLEDEVMIEDVLFYCD